MKDKKKQQENIYCSSDSSHLLTNAFPGTSYSFVFTFMSLMSFVHLGLAVLIIIQGNNCFYRPLYSQFPQFRSFICNPTVRESIICSDERLARPPVCAHSRTIPRPCLVDGVPICVSLGSLLAVIRILTR